jgi:hypothetical protein
VISIVAKSYEDKAMFHIPANDFPRLAPQVLGEEELHVRGIALEDALAHIRHVDTREFFE